MPEDRLTGQGRRIGISFVVLLATGHNRAPDPVVYFAGGRVWAQLRASVAARPVTLPARKSPTGTAIRLDSEGWPTECIAC